MADGFDDLFGDDQDPFGTGGTFQDGSFPSSTNPDTGADGAAPRGGRAAPEPPTYVAKRQAIAILQKVPLAEDPELAWSSCDEAVQDEIDYAAGARVDDRALVPAFGAAGAGAGAGAAAAAPPRRRGMPPRARECWGCSVSSKDSAGAGDGDIDMDVVSTMEKMFNDLTQAKRDPHSVAHAIHRFYTAMVCTTAHETPLWPTRMIREHFYHHMETLPTFYDNEEGKWAITAKVVDECLVVQTPGGSGVAVDTKLLTAALQIDRHRTLLREKRDRCRRENAGAAVVGAHFSLWREFSGRLDQG